MKKTILVLAGFMIVATGPLFADGSTIDLTNTAVASVVTDSTLSDSTVGIDIKTNESSVSLTSTAVASGVHDSTLDSSTVGITIDDTGADAQGVSASAGAAGASASSGH